MRAIALALLCLPLPAHANWEYTSWGMTPAQVVAASHGAVHLIPPQRRGAEALETRAEGEFRTGPVVLAVSFAFRIPDGGLALVSYVTKSAAQNYALRDYLVRKYGRPEPSGEEDLGSGIWRNPGQDIIDLSVSDENPAFVTQHPQAPRIRSPKLN